MGEWVNGGRGGEGLGGQKDGVKTADLSSDGKDRRRGQM